MREGSPGSDDSGSASTCSSSGGNLVQKQIERLYGGKERIVPVRLTHQSSSTGSSTTTSPPPFRDDRDKSFERQQGDSTPSSGRKYLTLFSHSAETCIYCFGVSFSTSLRAFFNILKTIDIFKTALRILTHNEPLDVSKTKWLSLKFII